MPVTRAKIEKNLQLVREQIASACARAGRQPGEVTIIAVTKGIDEQTIRLLPDLGLTELGESRVQQLTERSEELAGYLSRRRLAVNSEGTRESAPPIHWHMIGHLQRNKVPQVIAAASVIHSVDSLRLAEEVNDRASRDGRIVDITLQVNCSQEPQKFGCAVGAAMHLAELICTLKNVRLIGMMTMAANSTNPDDARRPFSLLREMFDELRHNHVGGDAFRHLSMGMSQDYTIAVEEGATLLRIGTALFE